MANEKEKNKEVTSDTKIKDDIVNIYFSNARTAVEEFLNEEFDSCPKDLMTHLLAYFNKFINYEEEGEKLQPRILLTNDIKLIDEKVPNSFKIQIAKSEDARDFESNMKGLMPFMASDWWIYININKDKGIDYGVIGTAKKLRDPYFKEALFSNPDIVSKTKKIDIVTIEQYSQYIINISSFSGKTLNVNFSFDKELNKLANRDAIIHQVAVMAMSKQNIKTKTKREDAENVFAKVFKSATKKLHGTICVIVDEGYDATKDKGLFSDGRWLVEPCAIGNTINPKKSKPIDETKLESMTDFFSLAMKYDGITIIDNKANIKAYNVFVETNLEKTKNVTGGARKRAAYTIINAHKKGILGIYFQSQEGELIFIENTPAKPRNSAKKSTESRLNKEPEKNKNESENDDSQNNMDIEFKPENE